MYMSRDFFLNGISQSGSPIQMLQMYVLKSSSALTTTTNNIFDFETLSYMLSY